MLRSPGTAPRRKGRPIGPATPLVPYNQIVFGSLSGYLIAIGKFAGFYLGNSWLGKAMIPRKVLPFQLWPFLVLCDWPIYFCLLSSWFFVSHLACFSLSLSKSHSSGVTGHFTQHTHLNRERFFLFLPLCAHGRLHCFLLRWYMPLRCCFGSGFCDLRGFPLETPFFIYLGTTLISEAKFFSGNWVRMWLVFFSSPFLLLSLFFVPCMCVCARQHNFTLEARQRARRTDGHGRSTSALARVRAREPLAGCGLTPTVST